MKKGEEREEPAPRNSGKRKETLAPALCLHRRDKIIERKLEGKRWDSQTLAL